MSSYTWDAADELSWLARLGNHSPRARSLRKESLPEHRALRIELLHRYAENASGPLAQKALKLADKVYEEGPVAFDSSFDLDAMAWAGKEWRKR